MQIDFNPKQALALRYLLPSDTTTKTIIYGGGGGAGKSWLAAFWAFYLMRSYKDLTIAVCRKLMNSAIETFSRTFKKVLDFYHEPQKLYKFTDLGITNIKTGSQIVYKSLIYLPQDPSYDRLGSLELTCAIIEEAQEITREAFEVLKTRTGRQHNDDYKLCSKILLTCNPGRNFLQGFVKKRNDPDFPIDTKVILATHKDNLQYLPDSYIEQLESISDPIVKARIVEGSWDFADFDQSTVIPLSMVLSCVGVSPEDGPLRLGIDIGGPQTYSDATIVQPVEGNRILTPIVIPTKDFKQASWTYDDWLINKIIDIIDNFGITDLKNVRIDANGIGAPIYEGLRRRGYSCYPFRGESKPLSRKFKAANYNNLRTQSWYEARELFRLHKIKLPDSYSETLVEDLTSVRYTEISGKIACEDKKITRSRLGRSPDYGDALCMALLRLSSDKDSKDSTAHLAAAV